MYSKNINILSTCRHLLKILIPAWTRLTELQATSLRPGQAEARRLRTYRYVDMLVRASRGASRPSHDTGHTRNQGLLF